MVDYHEDSREYRVRAEEENVHFTSPWIEREENMASHINFHYDLFKVIYHNFLSATTAATINTRHE